MNGILIPNEAAFIKTLATHIYDDTEFTEVCDQRTLTISWKCTCGLTGWARLSDIKQRRFGEWMTTKEGRKEMLQKMNGLLVVWNEREL